MCGSAIGRPAFSRAVTTATAGPQAGCVSVAVGRTTPEHGRACTTSRSPLPAPFAFAVPVGVIRPRWALIRTTRGRLPERRGDARDAREQDAVTREAAASTARQVVEGRSPRQDLERRERLLREQAAAVLNALADVEEALVREYDRDDRPQQADRYRRRAQQRRDTADGLRAETGGAGADPSP